jgi:hypothetical protein
MFTVPVYQFINGQKIQTGITNAEYLKDVHGDFIVNPENNNPYIVPVGYKLEDTFSKFNGKTPDSLLSYWTSGVHDLQRNFNGASRGDFVDAFTPIASFDYNIACLSVGLQNEACKIAGGALNQFQKHIGLNLKGNKNINNSGEYGNNPRNVKNMDNANIYHNQHYQSKNYIPEVIRQKDPSLGIEEEINRYNHQKMHKHQKVMDLNDPEIQKQYNKTLTKVLDNIPEAHDLCAIDQLKLINGIYEKQGKDIAYEPSKEMIKEQTAQNFGISSEQHQRSMEITAQDNQREKELGLGGKSLS